LCLAMGNAGRIKVQNRFAWKTAAHRIYRFFRKQDMKITSEQYA
jgi:hypothetical protein